MFFFMFYPIRISISYSRNFTKEKEEKKIKPKKIEVKRLPMAVFGRKMRDEMGLLKPLRCDSNDLCITEIRFH